MVDIDELEAIGTGPACPKCGNSTDWLICWNCGGKGGRDGEDLMEEDPLWYDEDDFEPCCECHGEGGHFRCSQCNRCFDKKDNPKEAFIEEGGLDG